MKQGDFRPMAAQPRSDGGPARHSGRRGALITRGRKRHLIRRVQPPSRALRNCAKLVAPLDKRVRMMADTDRKLSNGNGRIDFATEPCALSPLEARGRRRQPRSSTSPSTRRTRSVPATSSSSTPTTWSSTSSSPMRCSGCGSSTRKCVGIGPAPAIFTSSAPARTSTCWRARPTRSRSTSASSPTRRGHRGRARSGLGSRRARAPRRAAATSSRWRATRSCSSTTATRR